MAKRKNRLPAGLGANAKNLSPLPPGKDENLSLSLPLALKPFKSEAEIARRVSELAGEIHAALASSHRPIAVVVLQGAFVFAADLLRSLPRDFKIEVAFLHCVSYGAKTKSSGRVELLHDLDPAVDLRGRTVLLIDDILDSGLTLEFLKNHLHARGAREVRTCVLLRRYPGRRARRAHADFGGFEIGPGFVVGYGLDYCGHYRHLPTLAAVPRCEGR